MPPRVSLAMPVHNGERFVAQAIESILDQGYRDFELVISDNASGDSTGTICRTFAAKDKRIRYFRNERNLGAGRNFNRAFELTSGAYFKWCAHDDLISAGFLEECVRVLEEDANVVIAYPRLLGIDESGAFTSYEEKRLPNLHSTPGRRFRTLIRAHGRDAVMFGLWRRSALIQTSLHQPYYGSDCALLAETALLGQFAHVPDAILYSRDHPSRSVNLHSSERLTWQNPESSGTNAYELSNRAKHLVVIAWRHRHAVPFRESLRHVLVWAVNPFLLARLFLEGVGAVSPWLREQLRGTGLRAVKKLQGSLDRSSVGR